MSCVLFRKHKADKVLTLSDVFKSYSCNIEANDDLSNVDKEEQKDLLDKVCVYITERCYPDECGVD